MPETTLIISVLTTLFVTIDPLGLVPIFISVTTGMSANQKRAVAFRSVLIGFLVLLGTALIGGALLKAFGISLPAFQIAGGLLLFYTAFEMIFELRQQRKKKTAEKAISDDEARSIAVFPLAIPMIAGPGSISAIILMASQFDGASDMMWLLGSIFVILALVLVFFVSSAPIDRLLGATGRTLISRLMGVLLAALSVQFVGDGIFGMIELANS